MNMRYKIIYNQFLKNTDTYNFFSDKITYKTNYNACFSKWAQFMTAP